MSISPELRAAIILVTNLTLAVIGSGCDTNEPPLATPRIMQMVPDGVRPTATSTPRVIIELPANAADDIGRSWPEVTQKPLEGGMPPVNATLDSKATQEATKGTLFPVDPKEIPDFIDIPGGDNPPTIPTPVGGFPK